MDRRSARPRRLVIVGGGSAAFAAALEASRLGAETVLINDGLPIGGTCVNVGCVPSKALIRAAEAHHRARRCRFAGIESRSQVADFKALIAEKRELVARLRQARYRDVVADLPGFRRIEGRARWIDARKVAVNGETLEADRVLIATGAAPRVLPIPGLAETGYLTSESAFDLEQLPESLIVLGGRYVALESAQMFARFGVRVTVLQRSRRILPDEMPDLTGALTGYLEDEGIEIVTGVAVGGVSRRGGGVEVAAAVDGAARTFHAAQILAATGRRPNTRDLGLEEAGIELDGQGFVAVEDTLQTSAEGVYAAGDVIGGHMYVYTAAYEGALAAENACAGSAPRERDYTALPWVVFTDPQLAGVGLDERQAADRGLAVDVAVLPLAQVPRSLVARDTRGCVKLVRETGSDRLVGARILAPEGSELLMELGLAIRHGLRAGELASTFHPYLTLSEAVKLAATSFERPVERLSCCAA